MKIKYNYEENKISLWQAVFNKQGAKLAFSCPLKAAITVLLQTQKRACFRTNSPFSIGHPTFHWHPGMWKLGLRAKFNSTGNKKVPDSELLKCSWEIFATSGCLWVCKKTRLFWKYPRLGNYFLM